VQLREAGLSCLQDQRYQFARNCPPAAVSVEQHWARKCTLRFCCFCYARQLAAVFRVVDSEVRAARAREEPVKVVQYSFATGCDSPYERIYPWGLGTEPDIGSLLRIRHIPTRRRLCRRLMSKAAGGFYRISCQPRLLAEPTSQGQLGHWEIKHSLIALVPVDWQPFRAKYGKFQLCVDPNSKWLVRTLGDAFDYPSTWMQQHVPAPLITEMLDRLTRMQLFTRFGIFRNQS